MTLPANRVLEQRTPPSFVHIDKGLENQRVRTSASTPALVPLLAVLIAALPVPARLRLRINRQGESTHMTVSALVLLADL